MATIALDPDFPIRIEAERHYSLRGWDFKDRHVHDAFEIGYCHSGKGVFRIGDKILPFQSGDVCVINHLEPHVAFFMGSCVWSWIYCNPMKLLVPCVFDTGMLDTSRLAGPGFMNILRGKSFQEDARTVQSIIEESKRQSPFHREAIRALMMQFLIGLQRRVAPASSRTGAGDTGRSPAALSQVKRIAPALDHMHAHYCEKLSITELAKRCFMSPTNFRRFFKQATGVSPHEYLVAYRIGAASAELSSSDKSVERIAADFGFSDPSGFRKAFKHYTGLPAAVWRKQHQAGQ